MSGKGRGVVGCVAWVGGGVGAKRTASSLRFAYNADATTSLKQIASGAATKKKPATGEVHGTCLCLKQARCTWPVPPKRLIGRGWPEQPGAWSGADLCHLVINRGACSHGTR